jgi:hypothetical protein
MSDVWIRNYSGGMPVRPGVIVETKTFTGEKIVGEACFFDWSLDVGEVFEYRVIEEKNKSDHCKSEGTTIGPFGKMVRDALPDFQKKDPLSVQHGGDHYRKLKIQPIEYIQANGLGYHEGNVLKYITRWKDKDGIKDLRKAVHYLELLIEHTEKSGAVK